MKQLDVAADKEFKYGSYEIEGEESEDVGSD
mgnify:FL=1